MKLSVCVCVCVCVCERKGFCEVMICKGELILIQKKSTDVVWEVWWVFHVVRLGSTSQSFHTSV